MPKPLCKQLLSARTHYCSQLLRNFALGPYAILLSDRTQFCSRTVRSFALGPYAILLSDRMQFCSQTAARTRNLPGHRTSEPLHHQCTPTPPVYPYTTSVLLHHQCTPTSPVYPYVTGVPSVAAIYIAICRSL